MNALITTLLNRLMIWLCGGQLWTMAKQWVALYEHKDLSGAEKRARVAVMVKTEAKTLGVDLAQSLINFAVEAAVQYIRRRIK